MSAAKNIGIAITCFHPVASSYSQNMVSTHKKGLPPPFTLDHICIWGNPYFLVLISNQTKRAW